MNYQLSVGFNGKKDTLLKIINSSNKVGDVYTCLLYTSDAADEL